jgi:hypothetical protein
MTTAPNYSVMQQNLTNFYNNCHDTNIKFLFYYASDLQTPIVRTRFKHLKLNNTTYYIVEGNSIQYIYIYRQSDLKLLVQYKPINGVPANPNVGTDIEYIVEKVIDMSLPPTQYDVNLGNHLTYGIRRQRDQDTLFEVHATSYFDVDQPIAYRTQVDCNFKASHVTNLLDNLANFQTYNCLLRGRPSTLYSCKDVLDNEEKQIVFELTRVVHGLSTNMIFSGGKRYKCFTGKRGGQYTKSKGKKVYLSTKNKKGGTQSIEYKGFSFLSGPVMQFIQDMILKKVKDALSSLNCVQIIYDEANELNPSGVENAVFVYDFEQMHGRQIFFIDMKTLLVAAYANTRVLANQTVTIEEEQCLQHIKEWRLGNSIVRVSAT